MTKEEIVIDLKWYMGYAIQIAMEYATARADGDVDAVNRLLADLHVCGNALNSLNSKALQIETAEEDAR